MSNQMVKLTYTDEMKEQDKLWENEEENTTVMERLFNEIVEEAIGKGFTGYCVIYQGPEECICEVFDSKEQYIELQDSSDYRDMYGFCKPLIKDLEERLNF